MFSVPGVTATDARKTYPRLINTERTASHAGKETTMLYSTMTIAVEHLARDIEIPVGGAVDGARDDMDAGRILAGDDHGPGDMAAPGCGAVSRLGSEYDDGSRPAAMLDHVLKSGFPWPVF